MLMIKSSNQLKPIVVIAHNLRSAHNVGSLFRTCEGLGVQELILSGYTPYPKMASDNRLPHISAKLDAQIAKTALDAQDSLSWRHVEHLGKVVNHFKNEGYQIIGLEQSDKSKDIISFKPTNGIILILGNEVEGLDTESIAICDVLLEIPMFGKKESFNVVQAAAMALYALRFS